MRDDTTDVAVGLGKLRWSDSEKTVKSLFASTRPSQAYEGRNPRTGERVSVPAGLIIPRFREVSPTMTLAALVDFGPSGIDKIALSTEPAVPTEEWNDSDWAAWRKQVASTAAQLGRELGFGPVSAELMEQDWTVKGARVELFLESGELTLTIHRPDAVRAGR